MIKHIVMWRLKEQAEGKTKEENAREIKTRLEALNGAVDGINLLEVGCNFNEKPAAFDIVLYSEFTDRAALDRYQSYPPHVALKGFVVKRTTDAAVVDYEI